MTGKKDRLTIRLSGGGPWGFRLQGGYGTGQPLTVHKVRRKSKSYKNLREGDVIAGVNGHPCDYLTYEQVMEIADKSAMELCLDILREPPNKENVDPGIKGAKQSSMEKCVTTNIATEGGGALQHGNAFLNKEEITSTESTTKVTEQTDGMRIKSVTVLPDLTPSLSTQLYSTTEEIKPQKTEEIKPYFTEQVVEEKKPHKTVTENVNGIPPPTMAICPPRSSDNLPFDTSTKSVSEEVSSDDRKYEKTTTESVHEKRGNTETSFLKQEHESITRDGAGIFKDLEPLLSNGHVNFDSLTSGTQFDVKGPSSVEETRTFSSVESSSSVKETSSVIKTDMSDIITSLGLNAPFSELKKDSLFSTSMTNTAMDMPCVSMDTNSMSQQSSEGLFGSSESVLITKKKKMFSSSSFYEEPHAIYPTVEEQVEMAKKIADSLADDTNRKSKGANMFFKRVKRSTKWVHEGPEPSDESEPTTPEIQGTEPPTPDPSKVPWKSKQGVTNLRLVLDPRQPQDAITLKSSGHNISEHNVVSPDICHHLVRDLESPVGKGAALFAKRKKKSSEWVVDEVKVRNLMKAHEPVLPPAPAVNNVPLSQRLKLLKSPWEAALESPIGSCDAAFLEMKRNLLADSVIRAAESKLQDSVPTSPTLEMETCRSPPVPVTPAAAYYDIYKPKAPKGWNVFNATNLDVGSSISLPTPPVYTTYESSVEQSVQKSSSLPRKMVFQNFNTTPRKWKSPAK